MPKTTFADIPNNTASQWWKDPGLRINVMHIIGLCLCPYFLGFDSSLLTGLQALPQWLKYFHSPKGNKLGIVTAAISFHFLAERYGRKYVLWFGSFFIAVGALVNTFATDLGMYSGGRVILGFGAGMCKVLAPALVQEIAHPRLRALLGAGYYCCYYTGSVLSAWLAFGTLHIHGNWSWRLPSIFQLFGPIALVILTLTCPESPRWLVKKGRREDALQVLAKYHANGDDTDELVLFELQEIEKALALEVETNRSSYRDFFKTRANMHRLAILCTNWIGNGIINYYLSPILKSIGITQPIQITGINGGLQIFNLFMAMVGASLVERVGRRALWLTSTAGMLVCNAIIMALSARFAETGNHKVGTAIIPFLYLFYGIYDIAWTPLAFAYTVELLPFHLRTKGLSIFIATNMIAIAVNQFVNPIALASIGWRYYGVYLVIEVAYLVWIFWGFPETRGLTLEDASVVLDKRWNEYAPEQVAADQSAVMGASEKEKAEMEHLEG